MNNDNNSGLQEMKICEDIEELIEDLIYYIRTNDIEEVKKILEEDSRIINLNNIKDENDNTLLHFACANNNIDMILFLLYECNIDYNQYNKSGNSPLMWSIQNKHIESTREVLFFDYYLNKIKYNNLEKKKNEVFENIRNVIDNNFINPNYRLSQNIKKKINTIDIYNLYDKIDEKNINNQNINNNIITCNEILQNIKEEQLIHYKERNKINLLKKNEFNKSILSEAFDAQNEQILHLILNHPISVVLDNQEEELDDDNKNKDDVDNINVNMSEEYTTKINDNNNNNNININCNSNSNSNNFCDSVTLNIHNNESNKKFTTNIEEAKIIQEKIYQLKINNNIKTKEEQPHIDSNNNIIIHIREIGLNYFGDTLDESNASNDLTGINIWESCLVASRWYSDLCLENFFFNKNILEIGAGSGMASITLFIYSHLYNNNNNNNYNNNNNNNSEKGINNLIISDINNITLNNIKHNLLLNENILNSINLEWKNKITVTNIDFTNKNTYPQKNNEIIKYDCIIASDIIYDHKIVSSIIYLLNTTLQINGTFLYVCKKNRDGIQLFINELQNNNYTIQYFTPPDEYFKNPFLNLSQNIFNMKFSEFDDQENFIMMKCQRL
ncbi:methyltransferase, putative [Plasmodium sp. gorilla clade G2]|uniref:methyltransferase, putative n=1 Tax=Plasmodium sp. gorilla clade G2 TaxID=880535 RepID=UPI000D220B55|nr:methyltransferase, putative [Plasmodium sp. gorilla clade G2]SOV16063.1 methyltransferase, putative [Plasmodium sp. gorilla clade G2]